MNQDDVIEKVGVNKPPHSIPSEDPENNNQGEGQEQNGQQDL